MAVGVNETGVQCFAAKIGDAGVFPRGREDLIVPAHGLYLVPGHEHRFGQGIFGIHGPYATVYQSMLLYAFHSASCAPRNKAAGRVAVSRRCGPVAALRAGRGARVFSALRAPAGI